MVEWLYRSTWRKARQPRTLNKIVLRLAVWVRLSMYYPLYRYGNDFHDHWWVIFCSPRARNGDAGNGTHSTAVQLFRIWKCPYFYFAIYTCIERLSESSKWKEMGLYRAWWPCWRFSAQKRAKPKPPITEFSVLKPPKNPTDLPFQHKNES